MTASPLARPAGLVLAGGRSSRFGADKALQMLEGRTLLEHALAALDGVCGEVAVSAGAGPAEALARRLGRISLGDDPGHPSGPLAGLAAGLAWAEGIGAGRLLTLPCDTPLVGASLLARLMAAAGDGAAYARSPDGAHGLIAIWPTALAAPLADRLAAGDHPSVRGYLAEAGARAVDFADPGPFHNANTPADLAAIAAQLSRSSGSSASQTDSDPGVSTTS